MKITFVTGNQEKLREVKEILGNSIEVVGRDIDLPEIQEIDGEKIAISKAEAAYSIIQLPLIVDDSSLYINSWNGLPGALNKWFIRTVGNEGIIKMLSSFDDKGAKSEAVIAYHDGKNVKVFKGVVVGRISDIPKGENGFGWDKIFIPEGFNKTQAEMTSDEKNTISHRKKALDQLIKYLNENEK